MIQNSAIDRCVDEISSTLELAQALENQLERVRDAVSREHQEEDAALAPTEI
jgi:hypothetical protein